VLWKRSKWLKRQLAKAKEAIKDRPPRKIGPGKGKQDSKDAYQHSTVKYPETREQCSFACFDPELADKLAKTNGVPVE
jgi:hypothetical protein